MDEKELQAWLVLLRAPGVGAATVRQWIKATGNARAAIDMALSQSRTPVNVKKWLQAPDQVQLDTDRAWLDQPDHRLLCCTEADFPPQLDDIAGPPAALFVVGQSQLLLRPQVAIVGARGATASGLANARLFAQAMVDAGLVVTSGLADGIDGAAHRAVLTKQGETIAVMGTGPDRIYPKKHRSLAEEISGSGALVSEFTPGTQAKPGHFPRRNRLISGLSLGTLIVEASVRSGSLITARLAGEQGREVFALPGSIHNPLARGCHRLIKDGVQLVETVEEVLGVLQPLVDALGDELAQRLALPVGESDHQMEETAQNSNYAHVLGVLGHDEPVPIDMLSERCQVSVQTLSSMLLMLELEGKVASRPGGCWQKIG